MNYYIADTHFSHRNIIRLCGRPFGSVEEMNKTIIDNWNRRVTGSDTVYILGDFSYRTTAEDTAAILDALKGRKVLITGNHDRRIEKNPVLRKKFEKVASYLRIYDCGKDIVLSHYPMAEWDGFYRGAYHFYGHIHNNDNDAQRYMKTRPRACNVGVDVIGFCPKTADEIIAGI